jgi:peroxiredoxin
VANDPDDNPDDEPVGRLVRYGGAMSARSSTVSVGSPAPDFTLTQVGGGEVTLSAFRPKPVVLVFLRGFA